MESLDSKFIDNLTTTLNDNIDISKVQLFVKRIKERRHKLYIKEGLIKSNKRWIGLLFYKENFTVVPDFYILVVHPDHYHRNSKVVNLIVVDKKVQVRVHKDQNLGNR